MEAYSDESYRRSVEKKLRQIAELKTKSYLNAAQKEKLTRDMLDASDVELLDLIGRGAFGVVRRGTYQGSNVAVKVIELGGMSTTEREALTCASSSYSLLSSGKSRATPLDGRRLRDDATSPQTGAL